MKYKIMIIIVVLIIIFVAGCTTVETNSVSGPKLTAPKTYDFGSIKAEDGVVLATLKLKNSGTKELDILGVSTSCGCTSAEVGKEKLQPGEETNIDIEFDPNAHAGLTGLLKRIVYIRTNDPEMTETQIRLTVTVEDEHSHEDEGDHDSNLEKNQISPYELHEKIEDNEKVKIIDVRSESDYNELHVPSSVNLPINDISIDILYSLEIYEYNEVIVYGKSDITGKIAYNKLTELGYKNVRYLFGGFTHWEEDSYDTETNDQSNEEKIIQGTGPKIVLNKDLHDFGKVPQLGGVVSTEFTVSNAGDKKLEISSISTSCGCTTAEITSKTILPGESATLTVFFDPDFHKEPDGIFKRTVFLETNDPNNFEAEAKIQVEVLEGQ